MSWVAVAVGGGAVVGGYMASQASRSATNTASDASYNATMYGIDAQMEQFNKSIELMKPFYDAGVEALKDIKQIATGADMPELPSTTIDFEFDPNDKMYKIKQKEGEESINRALAARGMFNSRAGINALTDFNEKLIAEETEAQYGRSVDKYNRDYATAIDKFNMENALALQNYGKYADLINIGTGSAGTMSSAALNTGNTVMSSMNNLGTTQANIALTQGQNDVNFATEIANVPVNALASYYYGKKAGLWGN